MGNEAKTPVEDPEDLNALTLDDIEELAVTLDDLHANTHRSSARHVPALQRRRVQKKSSPTESDNKQPAERDQEHREGTVEDHFLPGTHSIFLKTWGCSHNNSDSEYMAGLLDAHGYRVRLTEAEKFEADLWILNSCTVKNPSEQTFVNAIRSAQEAGIKVIVAGCVPQAQPKNPNWKPLSTIGVQQIDRVVEVVEETLKGNTVQLLGTKRGTNQIDAKQQGRDVHDVHDGKSKMQKLGGAPLQLPKIRKNPFVEIVPINTGCLNQCTYCKTKHARGDLGSYPPEEIVDRIRNVLSGMNSMLCKWNRMTHQLRVEGITEIWLTSEDTGAYGRDIGVRLPYLLHGIVDTLDTAFRQSGKDVLLRIGMTNPPYILEDLEEIATILNHPRVYKFLHIPIQSASDRVLDDMRRMYTSADFRHIVDFLRMRVPGITIATDLICGFPTESEEDHRESVELVRTYRFPVLHISQFYPRPGTPAARMQRLTTNVVKQRSREVSALFESYQCYDQLVGKTFQVWITDEMGGSTEDQVPKDAVPPGEDDYTNHHTSRVDHCWVAHNIYYHQILLPKRQVLDVFRSQEVDLPAEEQKLLGYTCEVEVVRAGKYFMVGALRDANSCRRANPVDTTSSEVLLHRTTARNARSVEVSSKAEPNPTQEEDPIPEITSATTMGSLVRVLLVFLVPILPWLWMLFSAETTTTASASE